MHKHDLDLIAEYAAGTLEDAAEARSRIEACEVCAEEYRGQLAVLAELGGVGSVAMSDLERAALRRDIWTELRRSPPVGRAATTAPVWWRSWAFGAAAFIVVAVALIGVMENFAGGGDTAATFSEIGSGLDGGEMRGLSDSDEGGGEAPAAESATTTASDGATTAEEFGDTPFTLIANEVRTGEERIDSAPYQDDDGLSCLEAAGLEDHELVSGFESMTDHLIAVASGDELSTATVWFVDADNCIVVHIED